jgi:hypothetical protein
MRTDLTLTPLFAFMMGNWRDQGSSDGRRKQRASATRGLQSAARALRAAERARVYTIVAKKRFAVLYCS